MKSITRIFCHHHDSLYFFDFMFSKTQRQVNLYVIRLFQTYSIETRNKDIKVMLRLISTKRKIGEGRFRLFFIFFDATKYRINNTQSFHDIKEGHI